MDSPTGPKGYGQEVPRFSQPMTALCLPSQAKSDCKLAMGEERGGEGRGTREGREGEGRGEIDTLHTQPRPRMAEPCRCGQGIRLEDAEHFILHLKTPHSRGRTGRAGVVPQLRAPDDMSCWVTASALLISVSGAPPVLAHVCAHCTQLFAGPLVETAQTSIPSWWVCCLCCGLSGP